MGLCNHLHVLSQDGNSANELGLGVGLGVGLGLSVGLGLAQHSTAGITKDATLACSCCSLLREYKHRAPSKLGV